MSSRTRWLGSMRSPVKRPRSCMRPPAPGVASGKTTVATSTANVAARAGAASASPASRSASGAGAARLLPDPDTVELRGVLVGDLSPLRRGHVLHHVADDPPRVRPVAPVV